MDSLEKIFSLRLIQEGDRGFVIPLILDYFNNDFNNGSVVLPTDENAEVLWGMALASAQAGFPSLLALTETQVIGFLIWVPLIGLFQLNGNILQDLGCYVKQHFRGQGISSLLRKAARDKAREFGINTVLGTLYGIDLSGLRPANSKEGSSFNVGFVPYGVCGKLTIER